MCYDTCYEVLQVVCGFDGVQVCLRREPGKNITKQYESSQSSRFRQVATVRPDSYYPLRQLLAVQLFWLCSVTCFSPPAEQSPEQYASLLSCPAPRGAEPCPYLSEQFLEECPGQAVPGNGVCDCCEYPVQFTQRCLAVSLTARDPIYQLLGDA